MRRAGCALLLGAFLAGPAIAAPLDALDENGWYTWSVRAAEGAPAWCCLDWKREAPVPRTCDLDGDLAGFGSCDGDSLVDGLVRVYAKVESGQVVKLRVFGHECPVEADSGVSDLGEIDVDDSPEIRQHAAFVLAQSTSPNRTEALIRQARRDEDGETRAVAWFWLAQTGAAESEQAIRQAIAGDPDRAVREEAVFALSQLPGERAVDALIAVLEDRRLHRELREDALFWLAQSESERALAVFERLLAGGDTVR